MGLTYNKLIESIIDIPRKDYSRSIFDRFHSKRPTLKRHIRSTIEKQIEKFSKIASVKDYRLIGSILTKQYRKDADLDINILFDVPVEKRAMMHDKLKKEALRANGKEITGTKHPINYFVIVDENIFNRANDLSDAVYNIGTNKFEKISDSSPIDANLYVKQFKNKVYGLDVVKGEFVRDLIDFKELEELDDDDVANLSTAVSGKLKEIEQDMKDIINIGQDITKAKDDGFNRDMTPEQIKKYGKYNKLPKNVIYKMLEKYYYIRLYKDLKNVLGDDGTLSKREAKKLKSFADYPLQIEDDKSVDS
jgi:predicted nucleotidyltransferase